MPSYTAAGPIWEHIWIRTIKGTRSCMGQDHYENTLYGVAKLIRRLLIQGSIIMKTPFYGVAPLQERLLIQGRINTRAPSYMGQDHYENAFLYGVAPLRERILKKGKPITRMPCYMVQDDYDTPFLYGVRLLRERQVIWGGTITGTQSYLGQYDGVATLRELLFIWVGSTPSELNYPLKHMKGNDPNFYFRALKQVFLGKLWEFQRRFWTIFGVLLECLLQCLARTSDILGRVFQMLWGFFTLQR